MSSLNHLKNFKQNKKAIWRILEAFISVMLIVSVVLIIIYRQNTDTSRQDEIIRLERNILDYVSRDDALRSQILSDQLYGTAEKVDLLIPYGFQYMLKICKYDEICSSGCYIQNEVYSYDTLIVANLTFYEPGQAQKLKIFMWYGPWPDGCVRPNYTAPVLPSLPESAVLSVTWGNLRKNFGTKPGCAAGYDTWYYYDMTLTETTGKFGTVFGSRTRCFYSNEPRTTCDPLKTTMPSGMPISISAGQTITVNDRWFCIVPNYVYNITEAFYNDSAGANILFNYTIPNVD